MEQTATPSGSWADGDRYEAYVGRWSRPVARQFLAELEVPAGRRWLDVGCGTGALTGTLLAVADPRSVLGVDTSADFVRYATVRNRDPRVSFRTGDALALPVEDSSVDAVVSGLVLNFLPDRPAALAAWRRAAAPGGLVAAYVWDYASGMETIRRCWDAAVQLDPAAARLDEGTRFAGCAPGPLQELFTGAAWRTSSPRRSTCRPCSPTSRTTGPPSSARPAPHPPTWPRSGTPSGSRCGRSCGAVAGPGRRLHPPDRPRVDRARARSGGQLRPGGYRSLPVGRVPPSTAGGPVHSSAGSLSPRSAALDGGRTPAARLGIDPHLRSTVNETPIHVVGNVVDVPRRNRTSNGPVTNFRMASTARRWDEEAKGFVDTSTLWIDVACWGELGGNVARSVSKGDPVLVVGNLLTESWDSDAGRRSSNRMKATAVGLNLARGWSDFKRAARADLSPDVLSPQEPGEDMPSTEDPYVERSTDYIEGGDALEEENSDLTSERTAMPALT